MFQRMKNWWKDLIEWNLLDQDQKSVLRQSFVVQYITTPLTFELMFSGEETYRVLYIFGIRIFIWHVSRADDSDTGTPGPLQS